MSTHMQSCAQYKGDLLSTRSRHKSAKSWTPPEFFELCVGLLEQLVQILELIVLVLFKGLRGEAAQVLDLALQLGAFGLQCAALAHQRLQSPLLILQP